MFTEPFCSPWLFVGLQRNNLHYGFISVLLDNWFSCRLICDREGFGLTKLSGLLKTVFPICISISKVSDEIALSAIYKTVVTTLADSCVGLQIKESGPIEGHSLLSREAECVWLVDCLFQAPYSDGSLGYETMHQVSPWLQVNMIHIAAC